MQPLSTQFAGLVEWLEAEVNITRPGGAVRDAAGHVTAIRDALGFMRVHRSPTEGRAVSLEWLLNGEGASPGPVHSRA